jgi:hypothetical protein
MFREMSWQQHNFPCSVKWVIYLLWKQIEYTNNKAYLSNSVWSIRFWNNFHPVYSKSNDRITYDLSRYRVKHINITVLVTYTIHISLKDYFVSKLAIYKFYLVYCSSIKQNVDQNIAHAHHTRADKLHKATCTFSYHHHDLVDRDGISVSQLTTDMFHLS